LQQRARRMADAAKKRTPEEVTDEDLQVVLAKRQKTESSALVASQAKNNALVRVTKDGIRRTSSLEAPIMLCTGHAGEVLSVAFHPEGSVFASGSFDKHIFLWNVQGECENYMLLAGHKNAVVDLHWTTDGTKIVSASADKTVRVWDGQTGEQIKKLTEHSSFVNSVSSARRGPPLVVSGSDDGTAKLWDLRVKKCLQTMPEKYQVTSVAFSDDASKIYSGGLSNDISVWDLRKNEVEMTLKGHTNTITGMKVSPDGSYLLSNGMDNTLRVWDMRPFAPEERCVKVFSGHIHTFEKNLLKCDWSPDGSKVTCGSGDRTVNIWETESRRLVYRLPGHKGSVNDAAFHPKEPIVASAGSDKSIYLGEIEG